MKVKFVCANCIDFQWEDASFVPRVGDKVRTPMGYDVDVESVTWLDKDNVELEVY